MHQASRTPAREALLLFAAFKLINSKAIQLLAASGSIYPRRAEADDRLS